MRLTKKKLKIYFSRAYLLGHYPSIFKIHFSKKKRILYYGFLGDRNFGDEMVYLAAKVLFSDCLLIPYLRHMPVLIKVYCKLFPNSIDGIIIGGGTIIRAFSSDKNYFKKVSAMGKPIFFHGTGVDEHVMDKSFWLSFISSNAYGGLRGAKSQQGLEKNGFHFKQIGDAALYLDRGLQNETRQKIIVINFGTHNVLYELSHSRSQIIQFLKSEKVKDYKLVYVPLHVKDVKLGCALKLEIKHLELLSLADSYEELLELMKTADFCIGERLHFTVMSVLANTNFISVNYDQKHADFLESLHLEKFGFSAFDINTKVIERIFERKSEMIDWSKVNTKIDDLKLIHESERNRFLNS